VRRRCLLSGCVAAGFRYLDGTAIAARAMNPGGKRSWTSRDICGDLRLEDIADALTRPDDAHPSAHPRIDA